MLKPGQVAKRANITPQTVRNWSAEYADFLSPQARGEDGPRLFSDADVDTICTIAALRKSGVPPAEVSERLADRDDVAVVVDVEPTANEEQSEAKNEIQMQNAGQIVTLEAFATLKQQAELALRIAERAERITQHQTDRLVTGIVLGVTLTLVVVALVLRMV